MCSIGIVNWEWLGSIRLAVSLSHPALILHSTCLSTGFIKHILAEGPNCNNPGA
jgi:hypothetical protein